MDFSKLPSGPAVMRAGCAGLALVMAGILPLSAEPVQELKRSIDEAGTAVNRQLGDWLGVAPAKPARRKAAGRAKASTAIPLPPPRPQNIAAASEEPATASPAPADRVESTPPPAGEGDVAAPATPPSAQIVPVEPRPSRRQEPAVAALPQPDDAVAEPPSGDEGPAAPAGDAASAAADAPKAQPRGPQAAAAVPLPTPGPERRLAALPPTPPPESPAPEPSVHQPSAQEPQGSAVPTICPELSNDDLGVFTPVAVTATNTACTVDRGVSLSAVRMKDGRLVTLEPAATLRCEMAAAVARWLREGVDPAIASLGAPLDKVMVAASQQCRPRNRVPGAKISEHGRGNAMDTRGYVLKDGRRFVIGVPARGSADLAMPVAFQEQLKASACADFTTILGPGSDGYHEQHLHVDRAERRSGTVLCRWAVAEAKARTPSPPPKPALPAASGEAGAGEDAPAGENPGTSQ